MNKIDTFLSQAVAPLIDSYTGKPVAFTVTGAGAALGMIPMAPGASKVLHSYIVPYALPANLFFGRLDRDAQQLPCRAVSVEMVRHYADASRERFGDTVEHVVISGALSTNRYRRGENEAIVLVRDRYWRLKFEHLSPDEFERLSETERNDVRLCQDLEVATFVISKLIDRALHAETDFGADYSSASPPMEVFGL